MVVSISEGARRFELSVRGWNTKDSKEFKMNQGSTYTINNSGTIDIDPQTAGKNVQVATELHWNRWYGTKLIGMGYKKFSSLGNSTNSLRRTTFSYKFKKYIDTTSDSFYVKFGSTNSNNNFLFCGTIVVV